jgi:hypothetical protein
MKNYALKAFDMVRTFFKPQSTLNSDIPGNDLFKNIAKAGIQGLEAMNGILDRVAPRGRQEQFSPIAIKADERRPSGPKNPGL